MDDLAQVKVTGIAEFSRALKRVDVELQKELRRRLLAIAQDVARIAQGRMHFKGGSGRARASVKGRATTRGASIIGGGTRVPYYPWLEFGGSVGKGHKPGVGWSGSIVRLAPKGGNYIYPAIAGHKDETVHQVELAIIEVAEEAGFHTS